jgi:hypothetical protein
LSDGFVVPDDLVDEEQEESKGSAIDLKNIVTGKRTRKAPDVFGLKDYIGDKKLGYDKVMKDYLDGMSDLSDDE